MIEHSINKIRQLLESDRRLRELERAYAASGAVSDYIKLLRVRLRSNTPIELVGLDHADEVAKKFSVDDFAYDGFKLKGVIGKLKKMMQRRIKPVTSKAKVDVLTFKLVDHGSGQTGFMATFRVTLPEDRNRDYSGDDQSTSERDAFDGGGTVFVARLSWQHAKRLIVRAPWSIQYSDISYNQNLQSLLNSDALWYLKNMRGIILYSKIPGVSVGAVKRFNYD